MKIEARKIGGIWVKPHGLFLRIGKNYYNAYLNENKKDNRPDWEIYYGKKTEDINPEE